MTSVISTKSGIAAANSNCRRKYEKSQSFQSLGRVDGGVWSGGKVVAPTKIMVSDIARGEFSEI